jgi:soluble lytic murein transglycosylase
MILFLLTSLGLAAPAMVLVDSGMRDLAFDLEPATELAIVKRDWTALAALDPASVPDGERGDLAFLIAYANIKLETPEAAVGYLATLDDAATVPDAWRLWVQAQVLHAAGDDDGARAKLSVLPIHGDTLALRRAQLLAGDLALADGDEDGARVYYERLIEAEDPSEATSDALIALASISEPDVAYPLLRRVWWGYPRSPQSIEAVRRIREVAPDRRPTWQEVGRRAERLMWRREYDAAIAETGRRVIELGDDATADACRFLYARGRSHYKKNQLSISIEAFSDIGKRCAGVSEEYGAKGLYLQGTASKRKGAHQTAAKYFAQIPQYYPDHSMADDGYTLAGEALAEAEQLVSARQMFDAALTNYPNGDTVGEATWRLAWSHYLDGDGAKAREVALRLGALQVDVDSVHVGAGRYWAARWAMYPDVNAPTVPVEESRELAISEWASLCSDLPHNFYAIQAYGRLVELAPETAVKLADRPVDHEKGDASRPWAVRLSLMEDDSFRAGVGLARLGLATEAVDEWSHRGVDDLLPEEYAWMTELRGLGGDWLYAHDRMRHYLRAHPAGSMGAGQSEVLRVGYPDRYWVEVQAAADGDRYEPRLFHALVREESNFNKNIVSFAGAIGLSQVMPKTAEQTAGWMGMTLDMGQLKTPDYNLKIGARYLDSVYKSQRESPYLTLAGYNAGPGRVKSWLGRWGNVPTDEYVERIPFRETRGYVRRVMGTWQLMRYQFDETPAFYDLSVFNHQARPETAG